MAPLRSIAGRSLGKLLEGFKTSTLGQGFGSGSGSGSTPSVVVGGNEEYTLFPLIVLLMMVGDENPVQLMPPPERDPLLIIELFVDD